jgi:hypothetical protein
VCISRQQCCGFHSARFRKLANSFSGEIILPGGERYSRARQLWNHAVNKYPAITARCANREDVISAIEFSRGESPPLAVRSGGHSFAGHGVSEFFRVNQNIPAVSISAGITTAPNE